LDSHPAPRPRLCLARDVDCRSRIVRLRLARADTTFLLSRKEPGRNLSTAHFSTNLSKLPNYSSAYSQRRRAGKSTVKYHLIGFTPAIPISKDFSSVLLCMPPCSVRSRNVFQQNVPLKLHLPVRLSTASQACASQIHKRQAMILNTSSLIPSLSSRIHRYRPSAIDPDERRKRAGISKHLPPFRNLFGIDTIPAN
jgi:hypothetical protein